MPCYVYTCWETGDSFELTCPVAEYQESVVRDGQTYRIDVGAQQTHTPAAAGWPIESQGLACHPDQIQEYRDHARRHGVNLNFTRTGEAIFENRAHRRKALKAFGMHDRNGGYGDG